MSEKILEAGKITACKDCKFHRAASFGICAHPESDYNYGMDFVTGKEEISCHTCGYMRKEGECGIEARFFEPRR